MTSRIFAGTAWRATRRFVLGPWPMHFGALWVILLGVTFTVTWRLAGTSPMVPQTETLTYRVVAILVITVSLPAVTLVPLMIYRRLRRRWTSTPVRSTEYLVSLAVAAMIGAAIFNGGVRLEPTVTQVLNDPRLIDTAIRMFVPLWLLNAVLGTVFARIQAQSDAATEALKTVEAQRRLLLESEERVRGQVAAYLHDRVQTDLVSIGLRIRAAVSPGPREMVSEVDAALAALERVRSDEVRSASRQLSPNLRNVALHTALRELADSYRPGMTVTISISPEATERLKGEVTRATGIYRICEQALLNSAIHGHANECSILVALDARDAYLVEVRDNGVGLGPAPVVAGMGSTVIAAWVESLQGEWSLDSAPTGATLTAVIPTS